MEHYRPISLIHSFARIFSKLLAMHTAPFLDDIISVNQSALIKQHCIHDNLLHIQNLVTGLHRKKRPVLFTKLNVSNAFDSVGWPFLLEVLLTALDFGQRFCDLLSLIFASTPSQSF